MGLAEPGRPIIGAAVRRRRAKHGAAAREEDRQRRRHHSFRDGRAGGTAAGAQARARLRHLVRAAAAHHHAEDQAARGRAAVARTSTHRVAGRRRCDRSRRSRLDGGAAPGCRDRRAASAVERGSAVLSGREPRAGPGLRLDGARRAADGARAALRDEGAAEGGVRDLYGPAVGDGAVGRQTFHLRDGASVDKKFVATREVDRVVVDDSARLAA